MNKSRIALLGIAALAVSAYAITQDAVKISWKPKAGSVMKYRMTSTSEIQGQSAEFGVTLTMKIAEIKSDGKIVTKSTTGDVALKMGGQDMSSMIPPMDFTVTTVQNADGEMVSRDLDKASEFDTPRLEYAMVFLYPKNDVKVGDTWTRTFAGDKAKGIPPSTTTFTYKGMEKIGEKFDTHKITVSFKETSGEQPMTVTGTFWLKSDDGALLKGENEMKNAEIGGMVMDLKSKIMRISVEGA